MINVSEERHVRETIEYIATTDNNTLVSLEQLILIIPVYIPKPLKSPILVFGSPMHFVLLC